MKCYCVSLLVLMTMFSHTLMAEENQRKTVFATSEETTRQIEDVIFNKYMGGQISGDVRVIQDAFSVDAVMLSPNLSKAENKSLYRWLDMHSEVEKWGAVPNTKINTDNVKILKLDVIDERLATAQIKMEDRVYEVVTLVKIQGEWKIASKVYVPQK